MAGRAAAKKRRVGSSSSADVTAEPLHHHEHGKDSEHTATGGGNMEFSGITASTDTDRIRRFHDWLVSNGAGFPKFRIAQVESLGHGGVCVSDIEADEAFIRLPRSMLLDATAARSCPRVGHSMRAAEEHTRRTSKSLTEKDVERGLVWTYLAHQRAIGEDSFWRPYIDMLPTTFSSATSFPRDFVERHLVGTPLGSAVTSEDAVLDEIFDTMVDHLVTEFSEDFPPSRMSQDLLRWARNCFLSRALQVPAKAGQHSEAMTPLVDILNHRPGALTEFTRRAAWKHADTPELKEDDECVFVISRRGVRRGDQVFINYGAKDNHHLLLHYGFVIPENAADAIKIGPDDFLAEAADEERNKAVGVVDRRRALLEELTKQSPELAKQHAVTVYDIPADLLDLARAMCFESVEDLDKWIALRYDWIAHDGNAGYAESAFASVYGSEAASKFSERGSNWAADMAQEGDQSWTWDSIGHPYDKANEQDALRLLSRVFEMTLLALRDMAPSDKDDVAALRMVEVYKKGLRAIVEHALDIVEELESAIRP